MPQFEHHKSPQTHRVVTTAALVLVEEQLDVAGLNVASLFSARVAEGISNARSLLLIDPFLNRYAKSLFRPINYLSRNQISDSSLQNVLCLQASQL